MTPAERALLMAIGATIAYMSPIPGAIDRAIGDMMKENALKDVPCTCGGKEDGLHGKSCAKRSLV